MFTLYVTGCDFQYGSNFADLSSRGEMYARHVTGSANCKNSSVCFVMKCCPTSTIFRNPTSVQIYINWSVCGRFSTRSLCFCNTFSCARISIEDVGVIINKSAGAKNGSDCSATTGLRVLDWQILCSSHKSETASVGTELIDRNDCAKKQFQSYHHRHRSVQIIFHLLCFWAFLETTDSLLGQLGVRFLRIWSLPTQRLDPIFLLVFLCQWSTTLFLIQVQGMTNVLPENLLA